MKWFRIPLLLLTFASLASAEVICVGETSCRTIDESARASGLSLPVILGELDNNIVKRVEGNQNRAQADDLTRIVYSPEGSTGNIKLSLGGTFILGVEKINTNVIGYPFNYVQLPGSTSPVLAVEWGESQRNHIFNFGFKWGPIDYGTGFANLQSHHFLIRGGYGERYRIFGNEQTSLSLLLGTTYSYSYLNSLSSPGSIINVNTQYGPVGWEGDEKYSHSVHILGVTGLLIGKVRWGSLTLGADTGVTPTYSWGNNSLSKTGVVGPFLGNSGYFNIGVETFAPVNLSTWVPRMNLTEEWEFLPGSTLALAYGPPLLDTFHRGSLLLSHTF